MRIKVTHPDFTAHDFYLPCFGPAVEEQVNRLGPTGVITKAYDWPRATPPFDGWADTVNSLWWPRGADTFASCVLLLDDARADFLEALVAAQVAATPTTQAPRPYVVLSAALAPKEGAHPGEGYDPAGIPAISSEARAAAADEAELIGWKLYPLPPVRLTDPDASDDLSGLWLLPLVDIRYFYRATPLVPTAGGSSSSAVSGGADFPLLRVDHRASPDWMPPLRAYPDDAAAPLHYEAIGGNGTHPEIDASWSRGAAADKQARMENWRVVCRDVRTSYNALSGATQHTDFTGIVSDYPDDPDLARFAAAAQVADGGTGYEAGDELTLAGGTSTVAARFAVAAVTRSGAVTAVTVTTGGSYSAPPANPAATTGGSGTGCTLRAVFAAASYHGDAIRLAARAGNRVAGGACDDAVVRDLVARKLHVLFRVAGDDHYFSVLVHPNREDPTAVAHLDTTDVDGTGLAERLHVPKAFLGVECASRYPEGAHLAALRAAAEQWALLYYQWRRKQHFFKFPAVAPVVPNGYAAVIRWDFSALEFSTTYVALEGVEGTDDGYSAGREGKWGRIDGEGSVDDDLDGVYAWTELQDDGDATFSEKADGVVGYVAGVGGSEATDNPARDDADKRAVPVGLRVWMKPGVPFLDAATGHVQDHWRFTTPDLLQVIRLRLTGERNRFGHPGAVVQRWDPDIQGFVDSQLIWVTLLV